MTNKEIKHYSIPHLIHIEMTYSCNSKCFFCYNPYRNSPIDYKKIDKIVKSVAKSKIPHVYLIGGEPSLLCIDKLNEYIELLSKNSSVTIVTNGLKYMKNLSPKLACLGVAIHGDTKTQEYLSGIKGGYARTVDNVKKYIKDGFDVRCIPVLTSKNYDQIYYIIKLAKNWGMESIFVDKFEIGGMGLDMANILKPTLKQFKISLGQMIKARADFNIPVGFGTAIPYCLDERLIKENMFANCGVGVTFGAVNPQGDLRICNQSEIVYGNVLEEPLEVIWNKKTLDNFRNLSWLNEPCKNCVLIHECTGGCKVDLSCCSTYCCDYHVRENMEELISPVKIKKLWEKREKIMEKDKEVPDEYRRFILDSYTKINDFGREKYIVTRYQTVLVDDLVYKIVERIKNGCLEEEKIIKIFSKEVNGKYLRKLLTDLEIIGAIHTERISSVDWEITDDCNLKCKHCITESPVRSEEVPFGKIVRAINVLCENGLKEISITGGEPFVYPYLKDVLSYLDYKNVSARIITNGLLLTDDWCKFLKKCVTEVALSVDGTTEEPNDFIRGKGSFKKFIKSVNLLKKHEIPFSIYFTVHKKNNNISAMKNFAQELGAEYCRINEITKRGRAKSSYEDLYKTNIEYNGEDVSSVCDLSEDNLFISPNGDCYPCVEISQINGEKIGNIYDDNLENIYTALKDFIKRNKGKDCPYTILMGDYETVYKNTCKECESK